MSTFPSPSKPTHHIHGFLLQDPSERYTRARTSTKKVYEGGVLVEKQVPIPSRPYWKLSIGLYVGLSGDRGDRCPR